jgi:iron complex outermembrane receptor protein
MFFKYRLAIPAMLLVIGVSVLYGQTRQILQWKHDLIAIQNATASELAADRDAVSQIRTGVEFWIKLHPHTTIQLQSAPPQPWNSEQILNQVSLLREAVDAILKEDTGQSFELGMTKISVTVEASPLSPVTDSVDHKDIVDYHDTSITQALQNLPGVSIDHKSSRNQSGVMIRGFDTRQVGLYLDGIPILVPYDGYADLSRFLTSDIAVLEVSKGYSSPLLGPNGLGGSVNIVTRQPEKKLEGDAVIGTGSGEMLESGFHFGSRWQKFFLQGGMDWLQTDYFPLSGDFPLNSIQPTDHRLNSDTRDVRYNGRVGWTPNDQDQYAFTYSRQKSDYGVPTYAGNDPENNNIKYWEWPYWDRDSYYFNSSSGLGESNSLKFRAFYDRYPNGLDMFNDITYSSQAGQSSAKIDDRSEGFSSELTSRMFPRHVLGFSVFFKADKHRERNINFDKKGNRSIEQWRTDRDELVSLGLQDAIILSSRARATIGFSADHLNATQAQDIGKDGTTAVPFPCGETAAAGTCLLHTWVYNPLASVSYSLTRSGTLFFTFAMKSHFPTLKDRYSYKFGKAIPNPTLQPEHARNYNLGYMHAFAFNTMAQIEFFRSDVYDAIENDMRPQEYPGQCTGKGLCRMAVNVGKEVHEGVELTVRSNPMRRLSMEANYSYLKRTITGPPTMLDVFPTGTPKHKLVSTASLRLPHEVLLLAAARYEAGTITTNDSGLIVPASKFATADLGGMVPLYGGASLQVGVKNLFDRNYYYQEGFPEPGRNWYFNARYRF